MSEKLHIPSHRYGNKEYRDNFDRTFRRGVGMKKRGIATEKIWMGDVLEKDKHGNFKRVCLRDDEIVKIVAVSNAEKGEVVKYATPETIFCVEEYNG